MIWLQVIQPEAFHVHSLPSSRYGPRGSQLTLTLFLHQVRLTKLMLCKVLIVGLQRLWGGGYLCRNVQESRLRRSRPPGVISRWHLELLLLWDCEESASAAVVWLIAYICLLWNQLWWMWNTAHCVLLSWIVWLLDYGSMSCMVIVGLRVECSVGVRRLWLQKQNYVI